MSGEEAEEPLFRSLGHHVVFPSLGPSSLRSWAKRQASQQSGKLCKWLCQNCQQDAYSLGTIWRGLPPKHVPERASLSFVAVSGEATDSSFGLATPPSSVQASGSAGMHVCLCVGSSVRLTDAYSKTGVYAVKATRRRFDRQLALGRRGV
ncbi:unnamed protein product [Protopolystoma xenopodis]|uniref:Uncharacterized protein n=1 Tax=Protopolystoma xenopodis TaxID=117903 RepID=A0A3S5CU01_9PLAT|nr:unnamed protein product [Protopolystoma xenopodis]